MEEILEYLAVLHYEQNVLGRVLDECVSISGFGRCQTADRNDRAVPINAAVAWRLGSSSEPG